MICRALLMLAVLSACSPCCAALDSKQRRGSAIGLGTPGRPWLSEPSGTIDVGERLALATLFAGDAGEPVEPTGKPWLMNHINQLLSTRRPPQWLGVLLSSAL